MRNRGKLNRKAMNAAIMTPASMDNGTGHGELLGDERRAVGADAHNDHMGKRPFTGQRQQPVA